MKNITIKQLRAFVTVAQARSFTRAASRMHLSQSALTIAIKQLEGEVGLKLFDRTTRSVHLTEAGAQFLPVAERLLAQLSRSLDDLSAVAGRERGTVVAAASASFLHGVLAPTAARMRAAFPGIDVKLLNMPDNLARRVLEEEIDFGITNVSTVPHGLESFPLLEDVFGVVCPADHPLAADTGPLPWKDLAGHPFVTMPVGTQTREIMDSDPRVSRIVGAPVCETSSIFALGALVRAQLGIAAVPAQAATAILSEGLVYRPLHDPELRRGLSLVKRRNRSLSPAATEMVRAMTDLLFTTDIVDRPGLIDILADRESFVENFA
jgi:DNA-binding transcriptional LysR family regulator